jgi:hypothetical protein
MWPELIFAGVFLPLLALPIWLHKRLRNAVAERHPGVLISIDNVTRSQPRSRRALERVSRYKTLRDLRLIGISVI